MQGGDKAMDAARWASENRASALLRLQDPGASEYDHDLALALAMNHDANARADQDEEFARRLGWQLGDPGVRAPPADEGTRPLPVANDDQGADLIQDALYGRYESGYTFAHDDQVDGSGNPLQVDVTAEVRLLLRKHGSDDFLAGGEMTVRILEAANELGDRGKLGSLKDFFTRTDRMHMKKLLRLHVREGGKSRHIGFLERHHRPEVSGRGAYALRDPDVSAAEMAYARLRHSIGAAARSRRTTEEPQGAAARSRRTAEGPHGAAARSRRTREGPRAAGKRKAGGYTLLAQELQKFGKVAVSTPGDGNCQFHAFIQQVRQDCPELANKHPTVFRAAVKDDGVKRLRERIHAYIVNSASDMSGWFSTTGGGHRQHERESKHEYAERMKKMGEWGDEVSLHILATIFSLNIRLSSLYNDETVSTRDMRVTADTKRMIHLAANVGARYGHYESTRDITRR